MRLLFVLKDLVVHTTPQNHCNCVKQALFLSLLSGKKSWCGGVNLWKFNSVILQVVFVLGNGVLHCVDVVYQGTSTLSKRWLKLAETGTSVCLYANLF